MYNNHEKNEFFRVNYSFFVFVRLSKRNFFEKNIERKMYLETSARSSNRWKVSSNGYFYQVASIQSELSVYFRFCCWFKKKNVLFAMHDLQKKLNVLFFCSNFQNKTASILPAKFNIDSEWVINHLHFFYKIKN